MIKGEAGKQETVFKVECSWCGAVIRRDGSAKDSHSMCLKCYARMLGLRGHDDEGQIRVPLNKGDGRE